MKKQLQTERGLVCVEATFKTKEEAKADGYAYAFHSSLLNKDLFSKCLDDNGYYHSFALIEG